MTDDEHLSCNFLVRTCHQDLYLYSISFNSLHFVSFDYKICLCWVNKTTGHSSRMQISTGRSYSPSS